MDCERAGQLMSLRLDNEISPAEVRALEAHLGTCAECRQVWELMQEMSALFAEARMVQPPEDFTERLLERLTTQWMEQRTTRWPLGALLLLLGGAIITLLVVTPFIGTAGVLVGLLREPDPVRQGLEVLPGLVSVGEALLRAMWLILSAVMQLISLPLLVVYLWLILTLTTAWLLVLHAARPSTDGLAGNR